MPEVAASWIVLDIEGTTSATSSVHVGLYDYARPRLAGWITDHGDDPAIADAVEQIRTDGGLAADASVDELVEVLHGWMDGDVKATPLKIVQGQIWAAGFAAGDLTSQFFPDVAPQLREWNESGVQLAVFSSGSVASQIPWFAHTEADGDLSVLIVDWFDTVNAGPKREAPSYHRIAEKLGTDAGLVFLSDVPAELDAAVAAGWHGVGVARPGEPQGAADFGPHPTVSAFDQLTVLPVTLRRGVS